MAHSDVFSLATKAGVFASVGSVEEALSGRSVRSSLWTMTCSGGSLWRR